MSNSIDVARARAETPRLPDDRALPASSLAEFHGVPGAYLAKHLQALSQAGTPRGRARPPWRLQARSPCG
jgi:hypothetical protein